MDYLQKVNNVPFTYNIGKLCIEDPISVSRQFSLKFHAFYKTVLIKGSVLGEIDHFYWKKEYQARTKLLRVHTKVKKLMRLEIVMLKWKAKKKMNLKLWGNS